MNTYFSLSSTNNHNNQQTYETDYNRRNFRLTNTYSNSNMIPTGLPHPEQYQSTNDYLLPVNNMLPSSTFSMSMANPMLYYTHPWMRPGIKKLIKRKMIY
jgi:hypothetical protein